MIVNQLRCAATAKEKTNILKLATKLELEMFSYACSKQTTFGLKFAQMDIETLQEPTADDFVLLDSLASRALTGSEAREAVQKHCRTNGGLVKLICNKSLRCGVTTTTVNKVWPNAISVHKVQLAKEQPIAKVPLPCYAELKYDGVRITIVKEGRSVKFLTRNGNQVNLPHLTKVCLRSRRDWVLDTEVTYSSGKSADRTGISGEINSAMKGGLVQESAFVFNVFDWLPLAEFNQQICTKPYLDRRVYAMSALTDLQSEQFKIATATECHTHAAINELFTAYLANGYEGLILKQPRAMYEYKRSATWTKLKEVLDADLTCVAIEEGKGKYLNMIGALVCKGEVAGKAITVRVGSGLTDADRCSPNDSYVGHTIEVKYNAVVQDKTTELWALFLPRFVRVRFDK